MTTVLVTGSAGLIGSEAARHFHALGWRVFGVDNDMRARFFGPEASTAWMAERLTKTLKNYRHESIDVRDKSGSTRSYARPRPIWPSSSTRRLSRHTIGPPATR